MTLLAAEEATPTLEIWLGLGIMAMGSIYLWAFRQGWYERLPRAFWRWASFKTIMIWSTRIFVAAGFCIFVQGAVLAAVN